MYETIKKSIAEIIGLSISAERKVVLNELIAFIQYKVSAGIDVNVNFVCTHNSRRSHLSQIWAQVAASYYNIPRVFCYSGGTEATALFPVAADTLIKEGFKVEMISTVTKDNPIYMFKYAGHLMPVVGFSKVYDHPFNPSCNFAAVMTCAQADESCPFIHGAEKRISIKFEDPKIADGTPEQVAVYQERSRQIASEMFYVFSMIKV